MPFGLANIPVIFQAYVNTVLTGLLDHFIIVYLDDILIYLKNMEEYYKHVRQVLVKLRKNNLFYKLSKCEFNTIKVDFLRFLIKKDGIQADPERIHSIIK